MRRFFKHVSFILCCLYLIPGITQNNPFNIEGREQVLDLTQDSILQQEANIFDRSTNLSDLGNKDNPFEVSHIPLKKTEVQKKKRPIINKLDKSSDFLNIKFWVLIISCILLAIIMFAFREFVLSLYKPILNENYLKTLRRETNGGKNVVFILLYSLFFINFSLLLFASLEYYNETQYYDYRIYLYVLFACIALYLSKHIYLAIIGYIYPISKELKTYDFTITIIHSFLGIILIPINLLAILGPEVSKVFFLYLGIGIIAFFFLIRLFKGFSGSSRRASSNLYYFFIYLCSSEIAPLVILYSLIVRY